MEKTFDKRGDSSKTAIVLGEDLDTSIGNRADGNKNSLMGDKLEDLREKLIADGVKDHEVPIENKDVPEAKKAPKVKATSEVKTEEPTKKMDYVPWEAKEAVALAGEQKDIPAINKMIESLDAGPNGLAEKAVRTALEKRLGELSSSQGEKSGTERDFKAEAAVLIAENPEEYEEHKNYLEAKLRGNIKIDESRMPSTPHHTAGQEAYYEAINNGEDEKEAHLASKNAYNKASRETSNNKSNNNSNKDPVRKKVNEAGSQKPENKLKPSKAEDESGNIKDIEAVLKEIKGNTAKPGKDPREIVKNTGARVFNKKENSNTAGKKEIIIPDDPTEEIRTWPNRAEAKKEAEEILKDKPNEYKVGEFKGDIDKFEENKETNQRRSKLIEEYKDQSIEDINSMIKWLIDRDNDEQKNANQDNSELHANLKETVLTLMDIVDMKRNGDFDKKETKEEDDPELKWKEKEEKEEELKDDKEDLGNKEKEEDKEPKEKKEDNGGGGNGGGGEDGKESLAEADQKVINARTAYLKSLEGRRKWFRRNSEEEVVALRENYEKISKEQSIIKATEIVASEFGSLVGEEKEAKINTLALSLSIQEFVNRTEAEVNLASEGPGKKFSNMLKRHPKIRFAIGGLLLGGAIFSGGGALTIGFIGAKAVWTGVSTAVMAEGGIDAAQSGLKKRYGELKEVSEEEAKLLSDFGVEEKLGVLLARSVRRGESVKGNETVNNLIIERARDLGVEINNLGRDGNTPEQIRSKMLGNVLRDLNIATEKGQEKERRSSINRWVAAGVIGLVAGGIVAATGYSRLGGGEAAAGAAEAHEQVTNTVADNATDIAKGAGDGVAEHVPTQAELIDSFNVTEVAGRGEGEWHLAGRALNTFTDKFGIGMDDGHKTRTINWLKNKLIEHAHEGQIVPSPEHWIALGHNEAFSGELLSQAINATQ